MKNKIITLILLSLSLFSLGYNQYHFKKITEWDNNYINIPTLNSDKLFINKLFSFGNEGIYVTLLEHGLPLDIVASMDTGLNKWLQNNENSNYIENMLKLYGYRINTYTTIFNNIINSTTVTDKNKNKYQLLLDKYIQTEKTNNITNSYFKDIFNYTKPLLCKNNVNYPLNSHFETFYRNRGIESFKQKKYYESGCYFLYSGYSAKLNLWKGMILNTYSLGLINNVSDKEFLDNYNNYKITLYNLSLKLKNLAKNEDINNIHRNSTKKDNIILINEQYVKSLNKLTQHYLDLNNK